MEGKWRETIARLLDGALADQPGASVAAEVFGPQGLDEIEPDFFAFVQSELAVAKGTRPEVSVPEGAAIYLSGSEPEAGAPAAAPLAPEPPKWSPAELVLRPSETDAWLARAVHRGARGELEDALSELDVLAGGEVTPGLSIRITTEKQRLSLLRDLREAVLAELLRTGKPLRLERGGQKISAKLIAIESDLVQLEPGRTGVESLPKAEIPPEAVLALATKETLARIGSWIAAWPASVAGDARWKRLLASDRSSEALSLKEDAESFYPSIRTEGVAALGLETLGRNAEITAVPQATEVIDALRALWQTGQGSACLRSRATASRGIAQLAFSYLAAGFEPVDHLHASKIERLGDGRLRIAYEFASAEELEDWPEDAAFREIRYPDTAKLAVPEEDLRMSIGDGALEGAGKRLHAHVLGFEAPLTVRWTARCNYIAGQPNSTVNLYVGVCADSSGYAITGDLSGWMNLDSDASSVTVPGRDGRDIEYDRDYAFELRHDGAKVECWKDGVLQGSAPAEQWPQGRLFVYVESDMQVTLLDLVIEGKPTQASIDLARTRWVGDQVESLGIE